MAPGFFKATKGSCKADVTSLQSYPTLSYTSNHVHPITFALVYRLEVDHRFGLHSRAVPYIKAWVPAGGDNWELPSSLSPFMTSSAFSVSLCEFMLILELREELSIADWKGTSGVDVYCHDLFEKEGIFSFFVKYRGI